MGATRTLKTSILQDSLKTMQPQLLVQAIDKKDVGEPLPSDVWVSGPQGTIHCWSEGDVLRAESCNSGSRGAAPSAVVISIVDQATSARLAAAGDALPAVAAAALARGTLCVKGDLAALRPAAERIAAALKRGAPLGVLSVAQRPDGVAARRRVEFF